jgi:hypothetical protein
MCNIPLKSVTLSSLISSNSEISLQNTKYEMEEITLHVVLYF